MNPKILALFFSPLLSITLLSGCVSPEAATTRIKAFSSATTLVTGNVKESLDSAERKYFDVQVQRAVVAYDTNGFHPEQFAPLFSPETRRVRDAVLDSFALYGQKLAAIMGDEQLNQFDTASKELGSGLKDLSKTISDTKLFTAITRPLSDQEAKIVTTAIEGIGSLIIQWKREKAVRQAVTSMDTHIGAVCDALTKDLKVLRSMVANEFNEGMRAEDQFILHGNLDPSNKRTEIRALAQAVVDRRTTDATFEAIIKSVSTWRDTHANLVEVFDKDKTKVDALIQQLVADGTRVKKFYDSLDKK